VTVPYAKFRDPQTLNLYTYVENSPLNRIDADGHTDQSAGDQHQAYGGGTSDCASETSQQAESSSGAQNASLAADILNTVEVSASAGIGGHGEIQVGTLELSGGYNAIGVEGTTGLAGGNANATVLSGVQGDAKVPGASGEGKAFQTVPKQVAPQSMQHNRAWPSRTIW